MHIPDGPLSAPVLSAGYALATCGVGWSLHRIDEREIPRIAVLASVFFATSLVHVPLPGITGTSTHLVLCGLMGLLLGWGTFPAVAIALLLQSLLYGHGGLTSLGVNIIIMAVPGIAIAPLARTFLRSRSSTTVFVGGVMLGSGAVILACVLECAAYVASNREYWSYVPGVVIAHLPLAILEGILTGSVATFLARVRPSVIGRWDHLHVEQEGFRAS